jgi:16S rRNA (cytosine967-C5)-methyltransferase
VARGWRGLAFPDVEESPVEALSVRYAIPEWIIAMWLRDYGQERTIQILEGLAQEARLTVRTNVSRCTPAELRTALQAEGVTVEEIPEIPYAFALSGYDYLAGLDSFQKGLFYVQDVSSMMVVVEADPKPGDYVIDVCAAPGGKSTHMAELMQGTGMVEARDLTAAKVGLIEENIARHGLSNMFAVQMDATVDDPESHGKADLLVCDLPCSGLGVMGRKTDIRHKMLQEKLQDIVVLQQKILGTVLDYVKPGGTLLYSTCTVCHAENEENVAWILKNRPDFTFISQRQIFPGEAGNDGFFLAKLQRSSEE